MMLYLLTKDNQYQPNGFRATRSELAFKSKDI